MSTWILKGTIINKLLVFEITGDCQCGFRRNGFNIFWICHILGGGETMRQCIEFKEAYNSVRWEVLYNILIELGIPMKLYGS